MMEIVGPINLIYNLHPTWSSLPLANKLVATLYCTHYLNRAIISPLISAPSMSPIHIVVAVMAMLFNWINTSCMAGWLLGYTVPVVQGYRTDGRGTGLVTSYPGLENILPVIGGMLFCVGMSGNIYSERMLFHFRREEAERLASSTDKKTDDNPTTGQKSCHKVYVIPPQKGVFRYILYPHYVFEWIEWLGFALVGTAVLPLSTRSGSSTSSWAYFISSYSRPTVHTVATPPLLLAPWLIPAAWIADRLAVPLPLPAVLFVINAVANMLPHARWGRQWYVEKFGEEAVAGRGAAMPGCSWM